jgi:hypothetical protein
MPDSMGLILSVWSCRHFDKIFYHTREDAGQENLAGA